MANVNILIVDDHKIVRDGVRALIEDEPGFTILGEAENGVEAILKAENLDIDAIIMDITMPKVDGIVATERIKEIKPDVKILALTMLREDQHIRKMIKAGASGYILKSSGKEELLKALNMIIEGKHYFSDEATQSILQELIQPIIERPSNTTEIHLTEREIEVLKLIVDELTNQEIAEKLFLSIRTVDAHRRNLLQKIGAKNTAGLVKYAYSNKLFE